ncbi:LOW QUALITY PROTEIN: hypothetical protein PanWU01x14_031970 [Parasponia andersonii]|uniref:Uncharacterized protein n=1 Tax=Parasponia andersonii TaxID=3476 RepID=A0A2P5DUE0_PARAD|nr:LOW QUALITY PROTEIN: hypothetical protein PanWU01x14_031970 [Parasponia andersonii]
MDNLSLWGILCPILCMVVTASQCSMLHLTLFRILLGPKSLVGLNKELLRDARYHNFNKENFGAFAMVIWLLQTERNNFVDGNTLRMADVILKDAGRYTFLSSNKLKKI